MTSRKLQSIGSILKDTKLNKSNLISKTALNQIQKILVSNRAPVYHYQIIHLYNHLCYHKDDNSFNIIDGLLFPAKKEPYTKNVSFMLAIRRLYCLIKYQRPYRSWINYVRELLHQNTLSSTEIKQVMATTSLQEVRYDSQFEQLYGDFLTILHEEFYKLDVFLIVSLRKLFNTNRMTTSKSKQLQQKIQAQIEKHLPNMTGSQLKFIIYSYNARTEQMWHYFLKFRSVLKKYGFLLMTLLYRYKWCSTILSKYSNAQVVGMLPSYQFQPSTYRIVDEIFAYFITLQRPYIDQFFQFEKVQIKDKIELRLKNPKKDYISFLINAYYYFYPGVENPKIDDLHRMHQILSETEQLKRHPNYFYVYFSVRCCIIKCQGLEKQERVQKQKELVKQMYSLLSMGLKVDFQMLKQVVLLPNNSLKNLASLQFQLYGLPETIFLFKKLKLTVEHIYQYIKVRGLERKFSQMLDIIEQYIQAKNYENPQIFYADMKKHETCIDHLQVEVALEPQINQFIHARYLIRVKDLKSNRKLQYLLDFSNSGKENNKNMTSSMFWKHRYFDQWCKTLYQIQQYMQLQQYFNSTNFTQFVSQNIK